MHGNTLQERGQNGKINVKKFYCLWGVGCMARGVCAKLPFYGKRVYAVCKKCPILLEEGE